MLIWRKLKTYGPAYYISIMHPDDGPVVLDTYKKVFEFSFNLPVEEKKDYKTIFNFRLGYQGKYFHFVQQIVTLELTTKWKDLAWFIAFRYVARK